MMNNPKELPRCLLFQRLRAADRFYRMVFPLYTLKVGVGLNKLPTKSDVLHISDNEDDNQISPSTHLTPQNP